MMMKKFNKKAKELMNLRYYIKYYLFFPIVLIIFEIQNILLIIIIFLIRTPKAKDIITVRSRKDDYKYFNLQQEYLIKKKKEKINFFLEFEETWTFDSANFIKINSAKKNNSRISIFLIQLTYYYQ